MKILNDLFEKNKKWAQNLKKSDPNFFKKLAKKQTPEYLWIGCSDSRVPVAEIVDMGPGKIFVHQNIANVVSPTDLNCLSVIQYGVEVLKVKHIIVCGHYGCGGIKAALDNQKHGMMDNWLLNIKDVYRHYQSRIEAVENEKEKIALLCELNVIEQVTNACHTTPVRQAWASGQKLMIHGLIYDLEKGLLKDLDVCIASQEQTPQIYRVN